MTEITEIITQPPIYLPTFDPETGKYIDECPIPPRQRRQYRCMCNHKGSLICTPSEFKIHIKLKKHIQYIQHYLDNIKEMDDLIQTNKKLQADYELMFRRLTNEIKQLKGLLQNQQTDYNLLD